jgi:hypothetical protein
MKRLFSVNGHFFECKDDAKAFRDVEGGCVSKGPDHRLYGVKGGRKTHSHNSRSGGAGSGFPKKVK